MFVSTKDQGSGGQRRNRTYGVSKAARSSISLISGMTTTSSGSGGSTSTVTQESYTRSRRDSEKRRARKRKTRDNKSDEMKPKRKSQTESVQTPKKLSVFEFLVEDESQQGVQKDVKTLVHSGAIEQLVPPPPPAPESVLNSEPANTSPQEQDSDLDSDDSDSDVQPELEPGSTSRSEPTSRAESKGKELVTVVEETHHVPPPDSYGTDSDPECYYRSHLSDSGISMGSSSGEPVHLDAHVKSPLPPLMEETIDRHHSFSPSMADPSYYQHESQMAWAHTRNVSYNYDHVPLSPASSRGFVLPPDYPGRETPHTPNSADLPSSCLESTPLVFKDKNGHPSTKPSLFRTFEKTNARLLLQMQANIAELEHELTLLDARTVSAGTSAKHRKSETIKSSRPSVRDRARRAEVYQELHVNLDQYYQAICAAQQIRQITSPSSPEATAGFKQWLHSQVSPSSRIQFLTGDGTDLVHLNFTPHADTSSPIFRVIAFSIVLNIFLPLLMFKLISSVLNRMIFLSLVMAAGALALDRAEIRLEEVHRNCILGSAAISLVAVFFS